MAQQVAIIILLCPLLLVAAVVAWLRARSRAKKLAALYSTQKESNGSLSKEIALLQEKIGSLSKYVTISDAETEAARILQNSKTEAGRIIEEAKATSERTGAEAAALHTRVVEETREARSKTAAAFEAAAKEAERIISEAKARAETIAGDAYKAMNKAEDYERAAKAMKNVVEGYGDQYIIPSYSLLDGLADDFSHTDAGAKLKDARARTRNMIKLGLAATCDYVEEYRKKTAIAFVTDAFNGKADSILSRIREDNAGTLQQAMRDAFDLVNVNGRAFRDARISPEYLGARLEELHWGAAAVALREKEREEQRRIKEQIREEEKARREYERAMKEATREGGLARKALEKALAEAAKASDEQKTKYEKQIEELTAKLKEAEAKEQRALSMAQQTRSGYVYVISNIGSFGEETLKIGMTRRLEPLDRIRELGDASVPFPFDVHAMIYSDDAPTLEAELHRRFNLLRINKVNPRKEFFKLRVADIREAAQALGHTVAFTMVAEAREYRESLSFDKLPENERQTALENLLSRRTRELEEEEEAVEEQLASGD